MERAMRTATTAMMATTAALLATAGGALASGRPSFVHEPYVMPASIGAAGGSAGSSGGMMWLYYRIGVGATDRGNAQFENFTGSDFDAEFDSPGLLVSFAIGGRYRLGDQGPWGIRFEVEGLFGYDQYDRDGRGGGATVADGDLFEYGLSANIMPDLKFGRFSVFAGGGIGGSIFTLSDASPSDYDDSRGALSLQAMAGVSVELAEPVALYAMVRYRTYSNIHFYDDSDVRMRLLSLDTASLEVGLEFRF
jgi:opacity protein-like surface antigen